MKTGEVRKILLKEKLDAVILFNKSPMFQYFVAEEFDHGMMILTRKANYLFLSPLYAPKFPGFKVIQWKRFKEDLQAFIRKNRIRKVGFDASNIYLRQKKFLSKLFKAKDVGDQLVALRETKTPEEMARIRKACRITDMIFKGIVKNFKSFKKESDVAKYIKVTALEHGADMAFPPITASGKNAVTAHHNKDSRINKGFMVLDFGARYKGYCADMTRTVYVGAPKIKDLEIYSKVLRAQKSCIEKAKIGLNCGALYDHAVKMLGSDAKYFVHGLGHGFGVEIHEAPSSSPKSKDTIKKGSVITIEPGYYNPKTGVGIRIEDDLYFGKLGKAEVLTKSTKNLIIIRR
ncbi:M24 family metallopeptidase [Candidatus Woesearchaeota archaeon]|nr:M24 family metallopeptidase [Candidatus Woesearchaeota archaeon]